MTDNATKAPIQTHIVKEGEYLDQIANRYGMTLDELYALNKIDRNRQYIYPNEGVKIIDNRPLAVREADPLPYVNQQTQEYIVQPGDDYFTIAKKFNMNPAELMELNGKKAFWEDMIHPNDTLLVIDRNHAQKLLAETSNNQQSSTGGCPLNQEIAIFPVRYAIDEAPINNKKEKSKHPIPKDWGATGLPEIKTRGYTMRQLRDGWVYVWDGEKFDEYKVKGTEFKHTNRQDKKIEATPIVQIEPTEGEKGTKKYLGYKPLNEISIAYAQERWTERVYELMHNNKNNERKKWMRELDLSLLCLSIQPHTQPIQNIQDYVADIYKDTIPLEEDFSTTTVHTKKPTNPKLDPEIKPAELSSKILGAVPEKESAYFIALDDHLGILRDLNMYLTGFNASVLSFDENHQHKLHVANIIQNLCTTSIPENEYPSSVDKNNTEDTLAFRTQLGRCYEEAGSRHLEIKDRDIEGGSHIADFLMQAYRNLSYSELDALQSIWSDQSAKETASFRQKHPELTYEWFSKQYPSWKKTAKSRNAVKYDEAIAYLDKTKERKAIQEKLERVAEDIHLYLQFMGNNPQVTLLDHCDEEQSALLLTVFSSLHIQLSTASQKAKPWLAEDLLNKHTLIGLINYNFDKELAEKIEQMLDYYIKYNKLEENEPSFDITGILGQMVAGGNVAFNSKGAYGTAKADAELDAQNKEKAQHIISVDRIKNTNTYKTMSASSQMAFDIIPKAVTASPDTWESLQKSIFHGADDMTKIAKNTAKAGAVSLMQTILYSQVNGQYIYFQVQSKYLTSFNEWMKKLEALEKLVSTREALINLDKDPKAYAKIIKQEKKDNVKPRKRLPNRRTTARHELEKSYRGGEGLNAQLAAHQEKMPAIFRLVLTPSYINQSGHGIYVVKQIAKTQTVDTLSLHYIPPVGQVNSTASLLQQFKTSVGIVGAILVGLNLVNCIYSLETKTGDNNTYSLDDIESMITSQAYLANLLLTFETSSLWGKLGTVTRPELNRATGNWIDKKLITLSNDQWQQYWGNNKAGLKAFETDAKRFFGLARTMAVFGIIANGIEAFQILTNKIDSATTNEEKTALYIKGMANVLMGGGFAFQFVATYLRGSWLSFAFGAWFAWGMAIASVIYMAASYFATLFHYEGFDLWCKRCVWSKENHYWNDDEQGRKEEMAALYQLLLAPQAYYFPVSTMGYSFNGMGNGLYSRDFDLYLYVQLPALPTKTTAQIKIEFARKETRTLRNPIASMRYGLANDEPSTVADIMQQLDDNQYWLSADCLLEDLNFAQGYQNEGIIQHNDFLNYLSRKGNSSENSHSTTSNNVVWFSSFHREQFRTNTALQLEVNYPYELLEPRQDGKGYLLEIFSPTEYPQGEDMLIKAKENGMESTKQGIASKNITMLVENSPFKFDTLPALPNHQG